MKILQLISTRGYFGAENVMIQLSKGLLSHGYNPAIGIIGNHKNYYENFEKEAKKNGLEVTIFNCSGKFDLSTIFKIRGYLRSNKIDILHSHGYKSNFYGFLASLKLGKKRVATCHNWLSNNPKMKLYEAIDKALINSFDRIIAVSDEIREKIIKSGVSRDKVSIIKNGIDTTVSEKKTENTTSKVKESLGVEDGNAIIGTVGRLTKEKGHIFLIESFKEVTADYPKAVLLIVGDGPLKQSLELKVKSLNLENNVVFAGFRLDIEDMLGIMDIFVLPSITEGVPMALLEAMAAQKPVIVTKVGGIPKIIDDGYSGLLTEPQDVKQLAQAMTALLKDKNKARLLAINASNKVRAEFSAEEMSLNYIEAYKSLYNKTKKYA